MDFYLDEQIACSNLFSAILILTVCSIVVNRYGCGVFVRRAWLVASFAQVVVTLHVTVRTRGMATALIMRTLRPLLRLPRLPRLRRALSGTCALRMVSSTMRRRRLSTVTPMHRRRQRMGRVPTVTTVLAGMRTLMPLRRPCMACRGRPRRQVMAIPVRAGWVVVVAVVGVVDMVVFAVVPRPVAAAASGATRTGTGAATVRSGRMHMTRLRASSAASPAIARASVMFAITASQLGIVQLCAPIRGRRRRARTVLCGMGLVEGKGGWGGCEGVGVVGRSG